jgi:hypothetical protein
MSDTPALNAAVEYYDTKGYIPAGQSDKGSRWYPSDCERASCCSSIREPSRAFPWSYYKHCMTKKHIRQRLLEYPLDYEVTALAMTMETAPLYMNDTGLLLYVCKKLMGE